jgi:acyl carrier protein
MTGESEQRADQATGVSAEALLEQVRQLALEMHPQRGRSLRVTLDSALDRELAFDSLSRVELLLRLERAFGVSLPEQLLVGAETPRDLLREVQAGKVTGSPAPAAHARAAPLDELAEEPHSATTLPEMLEWHLLSHSQRPHVYLYGEQDEPETITYATLADGARTIAAGLQARGLLPRPASRWRRLRSAETARCFAPIPAFLAAEGYASLSLRQSCRKVRTGLRR